MKCYRWCTSALTPNWKLGESIRLNGDLFNLVRVRLWLYFGVDERKRTRSFFRNVFLSLVSMDLAGMRAGTNIKKHATQNMTCYINLIELIRFINKTSLFEQQQLKLVSSVDSDLDCLSEIQKIRKKNAKINYYSQAREKWRSNVFVNIKNRIVIQWDVCNNI